MKNLKLTISLMVLASTTGVHASDHWDYCTSADGIIKLENGEIVEPQANGEENYKLEKKLRVIKIKKIKETCKLRNSKTTVNSLIEETSFEVYQIRLGETVSKIDFVCKIGGSGVPASDSCDETTAKLTETYLVK